MTVQNSEFIYKSKGFFFLKKVLQKSWSDLEALILCKYLATSFQSESTRTYSKIELNMVKQYGKGAFVAYEMEKNIMQREV